MGAIYAAVDDVAAMWRPLTSNETEVAPNFLEYASLRMRKRVPLLDERIATDPDLEALARYITAEAVARALKNPEGWREVAIDDFRRVRDAAVSSGALYVSAEDVADLMPTVALGGVYSVPLGGPDVFTT